MTRPYNPGWESHAFYKLPQVQREAIQRQTDAQFREKTGVTRRLDPTSSADLELRRTWLRIRDEIVDAESFQEFRHEIDLDGLTAIPEEMRWNQWELGAEVLETWFGRPPAISPNYSAPVTNLIKMDWVLKFERARSVYEKLMREQIWTNQASVGRFAAVVKTRPVLGQTLPFGDLSQPAPVVDQQWINDRPVENGLNVDALSVAVGAFEFKIAVAGRLVGVSPTGSPFSVIVEEVGVFVKDSVDFEGDQFLGFWGYRDTPANNSDFREWRALNGAGGDFLDFSDIKRTRLQSPATVLVP